MKYRIDKTELLTTISVWNGYLRRKVHLVACGGTALTLVGVKESTKDVDFLVPNEAEYSYLLHVLQDLGYKNITGAGWVLDRGFIFDLYPGKRIFTTELMESPLAEKNSMLMEEFSYAKLLVLNYYDLIISKIFRYTAADVDDCLALFRAKRKEIDTKKLKKRFFETASYDTAEEKNKRNFDHFLSLLQKEGFKI